MRTFDRQVVEEDRIELLGSSCHADEELTGLRNVARRPSSTPTRRDKFVETGLPNIEPRDCILGSALEVAGHSKAHGPEANESNVRGALETTHYCAEELVYTVCMSHHWIGQRA
jgi:hypothetical protein